MCGIAGLIALRDTARIAAPGALAQQMADTLVLRGPDGSGAWEDADAGVGLGHRRLSIVDLGPGGAQPMLSATGRYVISFNGEIYNFHELRSELSARGLTFRSSSDTEVMLAAISEWGLAAAVDRFIGMFAFALYDRQTRTLSLVRDRLGVKPLYWAVFNGTLLFGSTLRALMAHPAFDRQIDPEAADALLRLSYIPAPATIFRGVFKLPPATILTARAGEEPSLARYWALDAIIAREAAAINPAEAADRLDHLLRDAIAKRMIADVPLGAFLSGGVDSSTVVALMQAQSTRPVKTFTIGFDDPAFNEAVHAKAVARHLGTDHTEIILEAKTALDLVTRIPDWFDEPFADSSQLPAYLVSEATRRHVTVALSGDGGDELFDGYPKYRALAAVWRRAALLPHGLRRLGGRFMTEVPERLWRLTSRDPRIGEKARRLTQALSAADADAAASAIDAVGFAEPLVPDARRTLRPARLAPSGLHDLISRMQCNDTGSYLPDDILTKVDRCSMAVSLEAREPLLDHRVVEYVWSLPSSLRHGKPRPKELLRQVLRRYVPDTLIDRPKRGFSVPLDAWLRGPLKPWADDLLSERSLAENGLVDVARIRRLWQRHQDDIERNGTGLWNVLMLQAWTRRWMHG